MNTRKSITNVRKLSTSTLLILLLISGLVALLPVSVVYGIASGAPKLGVVTQTGPNNAPSITNAYVSTTYTNGTAGNIGAETDTSHVGNLTLFVTDDGTTFVSFSGAQFYLYLSKNGLSCPGPGPCPGDIRYAGPFLVTALATPLKGYTEENGTYYIGTASTGSGDCSTSNCEIIEGPLPINIAAGYSFIKVYDGSSVAASQYINIAAGIRLTTSPISGMTNPPSGPANRPVHVLGGGFVPSTTIDLNYTYLFYPWPSGASQNISGFWETGVSTTSNGYFNYTFNMVDTRQSVNPTGGPRNDLITIKAVNSSNLDQKLANLYPATAATYLEKSRVLTQVVSFDQVGELVVNDTNLASPYYYGNDSGIAPILPQPVDVYATGTLWIAGNWWTWGGTVTFRVSTGTDTDFVTLSPASTTAGSSASYPGWFGINITVPTDLVKGVHTVMVTSNNVNYTFEIYMEPTLILSPSSGTASNPSTTTTVYAYGFPANVGVYVYWNETSYGDLTQFNLVNDTTGSNGQFNVTKSFVIPETYGGDHLVSAFNGTNGVPTCDFRGATFADSAYHTYYVTDECGIATTEFDVLPSLVVIPGSFNSTYDQPVQAVGEGFIPGIYYSADIDNQHIDLSTTVIPTSGVVCTVETHLGFPFHHYYTEVCTAATETTGLHNSYVEGLITPNNLGQLNITFIGAGFSPGSHVISLDGNDEYGSAGNYAPAAWAFFTVTPQGDPIADMLTGMSTTLTGISDSISGIQTSINGLSTQLDSISSAISSLQTSVNDLSSSVASISSTVSDIQTTVNTINTWTTSASGMLGTITTDVGTLQTDVSSVSTTLNSVSTQVGSINTGVQGISGVSTQATNIMNAVQAEQTYVLVVAVLAAITLVLVLAVLIRRLS